MLQAVLLATDIGNTQSHIGCFEGDRLVESWRVATDATATGDELAVLITALLELRSIDVGAIEAAIVSSVVPQLAPAYEQMCSRYLGVDSLIVGPSVKTGMPIRIEAPQELGADRLVNAVAAHDRFAGACVVVDFGTAINYDAVSAEGEYLGGVIAPGIEISIDALAARAARLPKIELVEPEAVIGRNTRQAIQAGIVYGFAGQIDGIVRRLERELGEGTPFIATGGQASAIVPFCETIDDVDELLTLKGLRLIWNLNQI